MARDVRKHVLSLFSQTICPFPARLNHWLEKIVHAVTGTNSYFITAPQVAQFCEIVTGQELSVKRIRQFLLASSQYDILEACLRRLKAVGHSVRTFARQQSSCVRCDYCIQFMTDVRRLNSNFCPALHVFILIWIQSKREHKAKVKWFTSLTIFAVIISPDQMC